MKRLILLFFTIATIFVEAQTTRKALFLGNSYTSVNNLPQIISDMALSVSDTLLFDSNMPGGYTLLNHSNNTTSQNKIMTGGWDYVVMQGQSQESYVNNSNFVGGALSLNNLIPQHSSCSVPLLYMTWGYKYGDVLNCNNFPYLCTYNGMDSVIKNHYINLANQINSEVSPVSVLWKYLRQNYPSIDLYQADNSHPSNAGSYAAACCFYASIFKKDPSLITYNYTLNSTDASIIKNAAKIVVFDSLYLWNFKELPSANFNFLIGSGVNQVNFTNSSLNAETYFWDFGDGDTSNINNPSHSYLLNGTYTVTLIANTCNLQGTHSSIKDTVIAFCSHTPTISNTSSPSFCKLDTLYTQTADAYQWYKNNIALPSANQSISFNSNNPYSLGNMFTVLSTLNGCSELSQPFYPMLNFFPTVPYYYETTTGLPCLGDTLIITINNLIGTEIIRWYKNATIIPNQSTNILLVDSVGFYQYSISTADCPYDLQFTNPYVFDTCANVGLKNIQNLYNNFKISPNPATNILQIDSNNSDDEVYLQIINSLGELLELIHTKLPVKINIENLPKGIYYLNNKNNPYQSTKFIKH